MIGKFVGAGVHRAVFTHREDPTLIIKIPHRHLSGFRNRIEWSIWNNAPEHIKKWLVPCVLISDDHIHLVCKKGEPLKETEPIPCGFYKTSGVPRGDLKDPANWVRIGDKILLADYANENIYKKYGKTTKP